MKHIIKPYRIQPAVNCRPWQGKAASRQATAAARWRANAVATSARPRGIFFRQRPENTMNICEIGGKLLDFMGFYGLFMRCLVTQYYLMGYE